MSKQARGIEQARGVEQARGGRASNAPGLKLKNDVFVIAQKIISKSEDRYIDINKIEISKEAQDLATKLKRHPGLIQCVLNESKKIISIENR